jgi:hypothetical protein
MIRAKGLKNLIAGCLAVAGVVICSTSAWAGWVITTEVEPSAMTQAPARMPSDKPKPAAGEPVKQVLDPTTTVTKFQGSMMCVERAKTTMIFDCKTSQQTEIRKEEKNYWRISGEEFKAKLERTRKLNGLDQMGTPLKFTATGKEEKIGEFSTKEYVVTLPGEHTVAVWTTTDGVAEKVRSETQEMTEQMSSFQGVLDWNSAPGFVIRTVHERPGMAMLGGKGPARTLKLVQTVTSIQEEEVGAEAFEVPKGFVRVEPPKLGGSGGGGKVGVPAGKVGRGG